MAKSNLPAVEHTFRLVAVRTNPSVPPLRYTAGISEKPRSPSPGAAVTGDRNTDKSPDPALDTTHFYLRRICMLPSFLVFVLGIANYAPRYY